MLSATTGQTVVRTATVLDLEAAAEAVAPGAPLLICGEAGVGKDTLARLIHAGSTRRSYAFIKVTCSAPSNDHHEIDLFGQEQGPSTAVTRRRLGSFEFANRGTLYLDEIEALPTCLAPKLLGVLRTGEVSRCGGQGIVRRVDARLLASTTFAYGMSTRVAEDLWHGLECLGAAELRIPPLRQRTQEIPIFASFFLERMNHRYHRQVRLCPEVIAELQERAWPGNLRELEEAIRRLVLA
jgi:transcriptional regulator with GAF, ATPase, and Fis domain